jgi:alginate O-acetyltransferase complex protein AlgI
LLFNSIDFIIFFILFLTIIYAIKFRKFQHVFLLIGSYFFFYYSSNYLIVLLIFTTIWDFYFGEIIFKAKSKERKKLFLIISLAGNLGLLGFFKYSDFAIAQFNFVGNYFDFTNQIPELNFVLPIAISFYTFHSITYTVSIYRNQIKPVKSFIQYAIFVSFFPQLVAGPILRAKEFLPQLSEKIEGFKEHGLRRIVITGPNLKIGITLMAIGFFKKMFIADNLSPLVNEIFSNPIGLDSFAIILGAVAFGIQIYCDFSGYSDIAIGAALILGFKIPINFNKPYFATSPSDFWRRWHISLSTWLRDYLYIPLGGNRGSKYRTYLNLIIVMFLGGLWHGASWNFVIWGLMHGGYLAIHKLLSDRIPYIGFFHTKAGKIISILITQYFVFLAWIPFVATDPEHMTYSLYKFIIFDFELSNVGSFLFSHKEPMFIMIVFVILHFISYKNNFMEKIKSLKIHWWGIFLMTIIISIIFFYDGNPEDFVYFKF